MIHILRLGHRLERDKRVTTHSALVGRALGADGVIMSGAKDEKIEATVNSVTERFGGPFEVSYERGYRKTITEHKKKGFAVVHLTMYGERLQDKITEIRTKRDILIIIGAEKVPSEIYKLADYNIAVTSQPHSEIAALAVFLHEYFEGKELEKRFKDRKLEIVPQARGKKVISA